MKTKRDSLPPVPGEPSAVTWVFGLGNVLTAILLLCLVFPGLKTRWWVVDVPSVALSLLLVISGMGLIRSTGWRLILLRISAVVCLVIGLAAIAALGVTAAYLSGVHGSLGQSGALLMVLLIALFVPYLVIYPSLQLLWAYKTSRKGAKAS